MERSGYDKKKGIVAKYSSYFATIPFIDNNSRPIEPIRLQGLSRELVLSRPRLIERPEAILCAAYSTSEGAEYTLAASSSSSM